MILRLSLLAAFLIFGGTSTYLYLDEGVTVSYGPPKYVYDKESQPRVSAKAWAVFDVDTSEILFSRNEREVLPIASITKLMTADVVLNVVFPGTSTTKISDRVVATEGKAGRLEPGNELRVRNLLFPLLLESSNDASEAVAEFAGREDFIDEMNIRARMLGMESTKFADPSGLSEENISSVEDLMTLLQYLMNEERHILDITRLSKFVGVDHVWLNNNPVYTEEGYLGGKHGFTDEAGRTFGGVFLEEVSEEEKRIGIVLLDSEDIADDVRKIRLHIKNHVLFTEVR